MKEAFYKARMKLIGKLQGPCGFRNKYISESFTTSNRELFNEALKVKKDLNYKFTWSSNGRALFYESNRGISSHFSSFSDDLVKKVKNQHGSSG